MSRSEIHFDEYDEVGHRPRTDRLLLTTPGAKPPTLTRSEQLVYDHLRRNHLVLRSGWPDFLCVSQDTGEIFAVEVKSGTDRLRPEQIDMGYWLEEAGITTGLLYVKGKTILPYPGSAWAHGMEARARR